MVLTDLTDCTYATVVETTPYGAHVVTQEVTETATTFDGPFGYPKWAGANNNSTTGVGTATIRMAMTEATRLLKEHYKFRWAKYNSTCSTTNTSVYVPWGDEGCRAWTVRYRWEPWDDIQCVPSSKPQRTPGDLIREIIQHRQAPMLLRNNPDRKMLGPPKDIREQCARETLRKVVGEDEYRQYIRNGFISVRPKSGLVYQIFPGHGITRVYNNGEQIERLCVVLAGDFPPTDSLIMRYILILNDEQGFRKKAVSHQVIRRQPTTVPVHAGKTLPEIYSGLKLAG